MQNRNILLACFICGLASLFYLYEFSLQVSPSVMAQELMRAFNTDAVGVGLISSIFYLSYTPVQIFGGVSYDYFGPRKVMSIAIFVCALGALVFAFANTMHMALLGRLLMGAGSACSFTGALLLISRWFPLNYFAFVSALLQSMSSVGAVVGQIPLAYMVVHLGWEHSILSFSLVGFGLCILFAVFLRDYAPGQQHLKTQPKSKPLQGLTEVLSNSQTWYLAIYGFCSWAPMIVFAALWGVSYLSAAYNLSTQVASEGLAMVWLGLGVGSPLLGWLSDKFLRRCTLLTAVKVIGLIACCILLYMPNLSYNLALVMLFFIGAAASGQALSFAVVNDINKRVHVGTAMGFNNMALVIGGLVLQPLASWLIHFFWNGAMSQGVPYYSLADYKKAMIIMPITYLVGILMSTKFIKETFCKQQYTYADMEGHHDNKEFSNSAI